MCDKKQVGYMVNSQNEGHDLFQSHVYLSYVSYICHTRKKVILCG